MAAATGHRRPATTAAPALARTAAAANRGRAAREDAHTRTRTHARAQRRKPTRQGRARCTAAPPPPFPPSPRDPNAPMKYVVITGGVVSGLGKGVTASSIGVLLKAAGLRVTAVKIDPS